jgi:PST family polysaccharide transporter
MKNLVKNTAAISITEFLLIFVAIIRNKYLAVTIGPEGFGILALLTSFFGMFSVFAGTWVSAGTTKYIAEYSEKGESKRRNQIFTFAFLLTFIMGVVLTVILIAGREFFISHFLSKDVLGVYYLLFAAGFIGMNLRPVLLSVLQGILQVEFVVKSRILISIFDVLLIVVLVYLFHLIGFFISIIISSLFATGILYFYVYKRCGFRFTRFSLKGNLVKKMMSFGGVTLLLGSVNLGSAYLQRFILVQRMGLESVGIFQAGFSIMSYIGLVNRGSSFHLFPTMSKTMDNVYRVKQLNDYLTFILFAIIPISVAAIIFGRIGIHILYSSKFLPLSSYLFWFILAQFITIIMTSFQTTVVGMAKLKIHTIAVFVIHSFWVIVPLLLIDKYGIASLPIGMLVGQCLGGTIYFVYLWKKIDFRLNGRVISLLCFSLIVLLVSVLCRDISMILQMILMTGVLGATISFLSKEERMKLYDLIRRIAERIAERSSLHLI